MLTKTTYLLYQAKRSLGFVFFLCMALLLNAQDDDSSPFGPTSISKGDIYALIIGISDYEDPKIEDLNFAHRDAEIFYDYLRSPAGGSVPKKNIKLLTETNATISNIYVAKQWLEKNVEKEDLVYFYFSGHGDVESSSYKLGFLLAYDTPHKNYFNNAVRIEDFNIMANTLSERKNADVIMITDACHSGKLGETNLTKVQKNEIRIASCESTQQSWEDQAWGGGRGAFSFHLINGLKGLADQNDDKAVTVKEIRRFLEDRVPSDVAKIRDKVQEPVVASTQEDRNKLIALVDVDIRNATEAIDSLHKTGKSAPKSVEIQENLQNKYFKALGKYGLKTRHDFQRLKALPTDSIVDYFITYYPVDTSLLDGKADSLWADSIYFASTYRDEYQQALAATIHSDVQKAINAYIRGDQAEAEKRAYYYSKDSNFDDYPAMLATAMKLIDTENYLYTMMDMKRHYFEGVNTRLSIFFNADKTPLIEKAIASQKRALALEDRAGYVYHELGELAYINDDLDTAIYFFSKALELVPDWVQPLIGMSKSYYDMDAEKTCAKWARKAIEAQDDNFFGYFWLAQAAFDEGDFLIAEENLLKSVRLNDKHYQPFEQLGYLNMELGNYEKSENYFTESELRKRFVKDYFGMDEFSSMYSVGESLWNTIYLELDTSLFGPNDDMAYFACGYNSFKNGNYVLAEQAFKEVIEINYKDPLVYRYLGELMVAQKRWMEAELYFDFALEMYLQKEVFDSYAKQLYKKQYYKDTIVRDIYTRAYYKAIENDFFLGYLYEKWGYYSKAEEIYFKLMLEEKEYFDAAFVKCYELYAKQELYQLAESLIKKYLHRDKKKWRAQLFSLYDEWKIKQKDNWLPNYQAGEMMYNLAFLEKDTILLDLEERIEVPGTEEDIRLRYYTYNKISLYEIKNYYERSLEDILNVDTFILANIYQRLGDVYDQLSIRSKNLNDEEASERYYQKAADLLPSPSNKEKLIQRSNKNFNYSNAFKELKDLREKNQLSFERLVQLGEYHVKKGSLDEDEGILDDAAAVYPIEFTKTIENEALNYFLDEDYVDAIVLYKQLLDAPETRNEFIHYTLARCYMDDILLDTNTAMIHLEIALNLGFNYTWVMDYDPIFSDQHDHPKWLELRARLPKSNIDEKLMEVEANVYLRPISH